jgi:phosphate transport system substrate-binding protein
MNVLGLRIFIIVMVVALVTTGCIGEKVELYGAGATFPAPIYARWRALYHRANPEVVIHYRALGSGRGIKSITARNVDFGASDALLKASEERALPAPLLSIPTVLGPVVMAYNLPGLESDLTLSGETVAGIYLGEITRWNDPRIAAINPDISLPDHPIYVAHRSDSSGTTYIFTDYLSAISETWRERAGPAKQLYWPTGDDWAGEGNDGVAHRILLEPGGIGYLELKYAQNAGLKYARLMNRDGHVVLPTVESVQQAESNTPATPGTYLKPSIVNAPGEHSYPIAGFTYLLVYRDLSDMDPDRAKALTDFLKWILGEGQQQAPKLHYTPLPESVRQAALRDVEKIKIPVAEALDE